MKCDLNGICLRLLPNVTTKSLLKNDTRQVSIKIETLMDLPHNTFLCVDMTGDLAFIYLYILNLRSCKFAEHV